MEVIWYVAKNNILHGNYCVFCQKWDRMMENKVFKKLQLSKNVFMDGFLDPPSQKFHNRTDVR